MCKVGQQLAGVHIANHGSFWNLDNQIFAASTVKVFAFSVHAIIRLAVWVITECQK
jgi:hypothetical protein